MLFEDYSDVIIRAIECIRQDEKDKILQAAALAAKTIEDDGLIYIFGCGHSGILSCEGFYRAGGLANVAPVFCEPLMLHESASESSRLEKLPGYAEELKEMYAYDSRDLLLCFSTSDKNAVPVEYAEYVSSLGVPTVGIYSGAYKTAEVHNRSGKHLHEVCTLSINNHAPFGDACLHPGDALNGMAPLSTITGAYILNSILAEAARLALSHGAEVPVYLSGNIPGGTERNQALIERYKARIKHL